MAVATSTRYKTLNDYVTLLSGLGLTPTGVPGPNDQAPNATTQAWTGVEFAAAVSQAESGGNPAVISKPNTNGTVDIGLWQINSSHIGQTIGGIYIPDQSFLLDPNNNARVAYAMSKGFTDWHAWCTAWSDSACGYKGGTYLGTGSPALKIYNSWEGGAMPGFAPSGGSSATPAAGTGGVPASTCVISLGTFGCLLGSDQARTLGGGALMVGGAVVMLAGVVLLFKGSTASAIARLSPVAVVTGAVGGRRSSPPPRREAPLSSQDTEDLNTTLRAKPDHPDRNRRSDATTPRPGPRGLAGDEDYIE